MSKFAFFDLDNTLVDQTAALAAWAEDFVAARGFDPASVDWFSVKSATSPSWPEFAAALKAHFRLSDTVDELVREVVADYPARFRLEAGVADGLSRLREDGWRLAVVTNGATAMQNAKVDRVGLKSLVDAVIVSETEGVHKPEREIFERAAKATGVELSREGWMVGDSITADIAGGRAAGLRTVWVPRSGERPAAVDEPEFECDTVAEAIDLLAAN